MKVVFLNPAFGDDFCKSARWFAKSRGRVQRHPDYLCQAIAVLEADNHKCKLIDGATKNLSKESTQSEVGLFKPDMVVIQTTTPSIYSDLDYAKMCKETLSSRCMTVVIGPHVSAEPEDTLIKSDDFLDVVVRGEYDYTLRELASGNPFHQVKGISYKENGQIIHNPDRKPIEDLNELPFPAWHHINPRDYPDAGKLYPFITLISGRGCSGRCNFCLFPQVMYGHHFRGKSPQFVVDEIEYDLKLFPFLKEIMFEDDALTLRKQLPRLQQICEEILRRNIKINWSANSRADLNDLEILRLMKKSGCRMLVVGFEFGNQQILNNVKKGCTIEQMKKFVELTNKVGIRIHGCFMIGGPGETLVTAKQTIDFAKSLPIDTAQFSGLCAYPGTEFYQWAKQNNHLVPRDWPDWVDENKEQRTIIDLPDLSVDQINQLVDKGLKEFYLRPRQMFRMFKNIKSFSDVKTKLYGLRSFVDYFS